MSSISYVYVNINDFQKAREISELSNMMKTRILNSSTIPKIAKVNAMLMYSYTNFFVLLNEKKYPEAKAILEDCEEIIHTNGEVLGTSALYHSDRLKTHQLQYYFKTGETDKAIELVEKKQKKRFEGYYENMIDLESRGRLAAMQNDYKKGYDFLFKALNLQRKEYTTISKEMNDLLYSHAEAESKRIELEEAEVEKKEQQNLIAIISVLSLISILLMFFFLDKEKRRSKRKVQELNKTADIEIEEVKLRASKEERKKIGQDLHDGLSSALAGILYHIEDIKIKAHKTKLNTALDDVYAQLQQVYAQVREKSHLNFNSLLDISGDTLEESIKKIVNSALKSSTKKEVEIDKKTAVLLNIHTRVEILRIIQEAMANIVKHAKKVTEVFIYLYEGDDAVILEIGNNGVVFAPTHQDGIGIRSIKSRVKSLGGEIRIEREKIDFQIEITLPK